MPAAPKLRLIHLEVENIKRLKAVSLDTAGNVIEITGANGQGKSSLLDSLWFALAGTGEIQRSPIRKGQQTARIHLDLSDLKVTRKFVAQEDGSYTTSITVENIEGARFQKPQSILDALISELTMDPLAFTRADGKKQFEMLKALAPSIDFIGIEAANRRDYDDRTEVNRNAKNAKSQASGISFADDTPDQPIDEKAIVAELEKVSATNTGIEERRIRREQLAAEVVRQRTEADGHTQQANDYRKLAEEAEAKAAELRGLADVSDERLKNAEALPPLVDPAEISGRLQRAQVINANVARKAEHGRLTKLAESLDAESKNLTAHIEKREADKRKAIADAKIPVDGIGFGDGFVMLNDQPFEQASAAEQLRAAIQIAIAGNPKLRLVRVSDGSLLDDASWALLSKMADELEFQVLVETVKSDRPGAIIIEDGMVAEKLAAAE